MTKKCYYSNTPEFIQFYFYSRIPAKIASFDDSFVAVAKTDVKLPCIAVGNPIPQLHWKIGQPGQPIPKNDRIRQCKFYFDIEKFVMF